LDSGPYVSVHVTSLLQQGRTSSWARCARRDLPGWTRRRHLRMARYRGGGGIGHPLHQIALRFLGRHATYVQLV